MHTDFLFYWSPDETTKYIRNREYMDYAASKQFEKVGAVPGDRVWVVTSSRMNLYLVGRILIEELSSFNRAMELLDRKDLFYARDALYAINSGRGVYRIKRIDITDYIPALSFVDRKGKTINGIDWDKVRDTSQPKSNLGQALQSIRRLSEDTASLFEDILAA